MAILGWYARSATIVSVPEILKNPMEHQTASGHEWHLPAAAERSDHSMGTVFMPAGQAASSLRSKSHSLTLSVHALLLLSSGLRLLLYRRHAPAFDLILLRRGFCRVTTDARAIRRPHGESNRLGAGAGCRGTLRGRQGEAAE
jgi:hypothetical protein